MEKQDMENQAMKNQQKEGSQGFPDDEEEIPGPKASDTKKLYFSRVYHSTISKCRAEARTKDVLYDHEAGKALARSRAQRAVQMHFPACGFRPGLLEPFQEPVWGAGTKACVGRRLVSLCGAQA